MRILRTRDGRNIGNAIVICEITDDITPTLKKYLDKTGQKLWLVETDFGNRTIFSDRDIDNYFYTDAELNRGQLIMSNNSSYDRWNRDRQDLINKNKDQDRA